MNKILSVFLCLLFLLSFASCTQTEYFFVDEESENASQEAVTEEQQPYDFISEQERLSWKDKIVNVISNNDLYDDYEVLGHNFLGMALMDMNFDNTPELIVAYAGGSMGNVCLEVYDLESGESLCILGETPHYKDSDNVYLCVYRDEESYFIVNEGSLRGGLDWYMITSKLTDQYMYDTLFEEVRSSNDNIRYYCKGNKVEKAEFEKQKSQLKGYEISETQMKIIYWEDIDTETKSAAISAMAEALVNSEQQFIQFDRDPVTDTLAPATSYEQAYLDFIKDKNETHRSFALVYVDGDDIPELYLKGAYEAEGDMVCSFKNGKVVCQQLGRTGGGSYIPKGGKIINQNGHMGRYYDNVYKLDGNGFSELLNAHYTETYEHIGNEEYITHRKYFISGSEVSEAEYNAAIISVFALQSAIRLDENAVSYEKIVQQLGGDYGGK